MTLKKHLRMVDIAEATGVHVDTVHECVKILRGMLKDERCREAIG